MLTDGNRFLNGNKPLAANGRVLWNGILADTTSDAAMFGHRPTTSHSLKLPSTKAVANTTHNGAQKYRSGAAIHKLSI